MKIRCTCGSLIVDQTDYMSDKAYFVADQDISDMREAVQKGIECLAANISESIFDEAETRSAVERAISDVFAGINKYARRNIYQCSECGILTVDDENNECQAFAPVDENVPRNILRSVEGENWKRHLRARWNSFSDGSGSGNLSWGFGVEDEGFEEFNNYETLEQHYFEVFRRLSENNILRDACFSKDGETVHDWSPNPSDNTP